MWCVARLHVLAERNKLNGRMETVRCHRIELDAHSSVAREQTQNKSENDMRELRLEVSRCQVDNSLMCLWLFWIDTSLCLLHGHNRHLVHGR